MEKSHRNHFHSKMVYFSLFIWPVLLFATADFSVKPFDTSNSSTLAKWMDPKQISFFSLQVILDMFSFGASFNRHGKCHGNAKMEHLNLYF